MGDCMATWEIDFIQRKLGRRCFVCHISTSHHKDLDDYDGISLCLSSRIIFLKHSFPLSKNLKQ